MKYIYMILIAISLISCKVDDPNGGVVVCERMCAQPEPLPGDPEPYLLLESAPEQVCKNPPNDDGCRTVCYKEDEEEVPPNPGPVPIEPPVTIGPYPVDPVEPPYTIGPEPYIPHKDDEEDEDSKEQGIAVHSHEIPDEFDQEELPDCDDYFQGTDSNGQVIQDDDLEQE